MWDFDTFAGAVRSMGSQRPGESERPTANEPTLQIGPHVTQLHKIKPVTNCNTTVEYNDMLLWSSSFLLFGYSRHDGQAKALQKCTEARM